MIENAIEPNELERYLANKIKNDGFPVTFQTTGPIDLVWLDTIVTKILYRQKILSAVQIDVQDAPNTYKIFTA